MYVCLDCIDDSDKNKISMPESRGPCEVCGKVKNCHNIPRHIKIKTPGALPQKGWIKQNAGSNTILIKSDSRTIARIIHPHGDDQAQRDASLITAAPDLLEACKKYVAIWDVDISMSNTQKESLSAAKKAIAKAEAL